MERTEPIPTEPTAPTPTEPTAPTPTGRTAPAEHPALAELIGPGAVAGFLAERLGRGPYRTRIGQAAVRRLFGWPQLNAALAAHRLAPPRLRLERQGVEASRAALKSRRTRRGTVMQDLDPAALNRALRDGATLIVDAVNELHPPLARLCEGLAAEFLASCQANLYACWGTTQGFDVHWDDHDVFVVQVEGRKRWALYGETLAQPTRAGPCQPEPPDAPAEEFELGAGEVLYLPRGHWHAAVGLGEPSLHLTIGLTRKSGGDFLRWLADQALAEAPVRADLPLEKGEAALAGRLAAILGGLAAQPPQDLARRYLRHVEATQVHRPRLSFPHLGVEGEQIAPDARIRLAPGRARAVPNGDEAVLHWRGVAFTVDGALEAPLRRLAAGERLTVSDLEAALPPARRPQLQPFLAEMIGRGVFVVGDLP